jgi:PPOX class probable F420-dependent enzyme
MPSTNETLWELVCSRRSGILATIGATGFPHLTNVNYLVDAEPRVVLLTTTATRVKGKNLLRDPHVALHVAGDDQFNFAVVEGLAAAAIAEEVGDPATDGLHQIFSAFRGPQERPASAEQMIAERRMVVNVAVERVYGLVVPAAREGAA